MKIMTILGCNSEWETNAGSMLFCALGLHPVWLSPSCKDHRVYIQCGAFYINTTFVASLWLGGVPQITLKLHLSCICLFGDVNTRSTISHWRATPTFVYAREKHPNTIQNATFTTSITKIINCFLFRGIFVPVTRTADCLWPDGSKTNESGHYERLEGLVVIRATPWFWWLAVCQCLPHNRLPFVESGDIGEQKTEQMYMVISYSRIRHKIYTVTHLLTAKYLVLFIDFLFVCLKTIIIDVLRFITTTTTTTTSAAILYLLLLIIIIKQLNIY